MLYIHAKSVTITRSYFPSKYICPVTKQDYSHCPSLPKTHWRKLEFHSPTSVLCGILVLFLNKGTFPPRHREQEKVLLNIHLLGEALRVPLQGFSQGWQRYYFDGTAALCLLLLNLLSSIFPQTLITETRFKCCWGVLCTLCQGISRQDNESSYCKLILILRRRDGRDKYVWQPGEPDHPVAWEGPGNYRIEPHK